MRDRLTPKDALVYIALSQQDLAGIYWMIWEPVMMSGLKAFQFFGTMRAGGNVLFDLQRMRRVELTVDEAVKHQRPLLTWFGGGAIHRCSP